jgi:hypothetical protein
MAMDGDGIAAIGGADSSGFTAIRIHRLQY